MIIMHILQVICMYIRINNGVQGIITFLPSALCYAVACRETRFSEPAYSGNMYIVKRNPNHMSIKAHIFSLSYNEDNSVRTGLLSMSCRVIGNLNILRLSSH